MTSQHGYPRGQHRDHHGKAKHRHIATINHCDDAPCGWWHFTSQMGKTTT